VTASPDATPSRSRSPWTAAFPAAALLTVIALVTWYKLTPIAGPVPVGKGDNGAAAKSAPLARAPNESARGEAGAAEQTAPAESTDSAVDAAQLVSQAIAQIQAGNFDRGQELTTRAVELDLDHSGAYAYRALAQALVYEDDAVADANRALGIDPDSSVALAARGLAMAAMGEMGQATRDVNAALRHDPGDGLPHLIHGLVFYLQNQDAKAIEAFDRTAATEWRALALAQRSRAYVRLRSSLAQKAVADAARAIELEPNAVAYVVRSQAYLQLGAADKAVEDATEAIRMDPDEPQGYLARSQAYLQLGASDKADKGAADTQPNLK
jgi:tetratricopeptide (TPR) repeat protein